MISIAKSLSVDAIGDTSQHRMKSCGILYVYSNSSMRSTVTTNYKALQKMFSNMHYLYSRWIIVSLVYVEVHLLLLLFYAMILANRYTAGLPAAWILTQRTQSIMYSACTRQSSCGSKSKVLDYITGNDRPDRSLISIPFRHQNWSPHCGCLSNLK